jgi:transcriptional regulator with GAF, ATPase, and Fis domain
MQQIASKNVTVLIRGETGAGQELIASLIHGTRSSALP